MLYEGDIVEVTNLDESVQEMLADALETEFEDIEFYFVEYQDDYYAVLSAETDTKFAIVHCPLSAIKDYYDDGAEVEELLDHVIGTLILDRALDERNKELFQTIMDYQALPRPERHKESEEEHMYIEVILDMDGNEYMEEMLGDED